MSQNEGFFGGICYLYTSCVDCDFIIHVLSLLAVAVVVTAGAVAVGTVVLAVTVVAVTAASVGRTLPARRSKPSLRFSPLRAQSHRLGLACSSPAGPGPTPPVRRWLGVGRGCVLKNAGPAAGLPRSTPPGCHSLAR